LLEQDDALARALSSHCLEEPPLPRRSFVVEKNVELLRQTAPHPFIVEACGNKLFGSSELPPFTTFAVMSPNA